MSVSPIRLLMIGSLPPPLGGTTVSFCQLISELEQRPDVEIEVIDTSRNDESVGLWRNVATAVRITRKATRALGRTQLVTFHASTPGTVCFGPLIYALSRLFRVPLIIREFGGSLDNDYQEMSALARSVIRRVFRAERVLLQTRSLMEYFQRQFPESQFAWYPNSRPIPSVPAEPAPPRLARRFVYVGHVKTTKGLREILTAAEKLLAQDCTVDVYGPFSDGFSEREFEGNTRVTYHGVLTPDQVIPTLRRYDAVLLPTYHFGEGYPGVILEAYAAGLPVIASRWRSIPEIVEEGVSGLLVEPRDADDLARAMNRLCEDPECLRVLIQGACALAQRFRSELWTDEFIWICRQVLAEHAG